MEGWDEPVRVHNGKSTLCTQWPILMEVVTGHKRTYFYRILSQFTFTIYTVRLLSFRTDWPEPVLREPSGGHPQEHVGASLDTLCA
jgi:hypothetical protein